MVEPIVLTRVVAGRDREVTAPQLVDVVLLLTHRSEDHILAPAHKCKTLLRLFVHFLPHNYQLSSDSTLLVE